MDRRALGYLVVVAVALSACGLSEAEVAGTVQVAVAETLTAVPTITPVPTPMPTEPIIPEEFRRQLVRVLEEGARTVAMTATGVTHRDLSQQVSSTKGAYDLAAAMWPPTFPGGARYQIESALLVWDLSLFAWSRIRTRATGRINDNEPEYAIIVEYAADGGHELYVHDYGPGITYAEHYLTVNKALVEFLLSVASEHFELAKTQILESLEEG